ncbi:MAG: hypothetical protein JW744_04095 [Candidatus Diapherotrites archaeon]|uniref:Pantothenate kinase n=1 Tax=Candidatus Iainarchaeum sp. TaxID=3101447 RepID=A0A939C926_9ARCH|nr:hypothetical protein [Candidatus Diapherotrites archaeon]
MILGIDFGASTTDAVLLQGKRIVKKACAERVLVSPKELDSFLKKNKFHKFQIEGVAISGGKSAGFHKKILGIKPKHVNEIDAIAFGAKFLTGSKRFLAVSMGTGTCIVLFQKKAGHVIGTGLGGGTVLGLSRLLLNESSPKKLAKLAEGGNLRNVDLSVKDVAGGKIGLLNADATASNFGKQGRHSRADLAAAVQSMAAEAVAVLAIAASRQCNCRKVIFLGRTLSFPLVRKRLKKAAELFKAEFSFPKDAEFGTAAGAAYYAQFKKQGRC